MNDEITRINDLERVQRDDDHHRPGRTASIALILAIAACSKVPPAALATAPSASPAPVAAPDVDAGVADGEADASAQSSADGGKRWVAMRLKADGLDLGDFAIASAPDARHEGGVVAALGWSGDGADVFVVAIDVATARELGRTRLGPWDPDASTMIAGVPRGVVVATQNKAALELVWVNPNTMATTRKALPGLGTDSGHDLLGLAAFDDRVVLASEGRSTTDLRLLDAEGNLLGIHACRGSLHRPGYADLVRAGDQVVLANLVPNVDDFVPVCAGHLHGAPRWRDVLFKDGQVSLGPGGVYVAIGDGPAKKLDAALRPTGPELPPDPEPTHGPCEGLSGTSVWQAETIGDVGIVRTVSCCGDPSPGGLFVCRPKG